MKTPRRKQMHHGESSWRLAAAMLCGLVALLAPGSAVADTRCDAVMENSEVGAEKARADAQPCDRDELLDEFLQGWEEFIESCDLITTQIGPSHAEQGPYAAEVGRARNMTALLDGGQHSAKQLDSIMGDLNLAGSRLADFNASFEPTETGEAADAAPGDTVDEDDIKVFCQARIERKNARVWRNRFRECLAELKAADADPAPEDIE